MYTIACTLLYFHYAGPGHLWRAQTLTFDGFGLGQWLVVTDDKITCDGWNTRHR
jgi:hypothetical protein